MPEYLLIPFAYLCGSVSSAIIVCKLMRLDDPRTRGSGNPGATNVLRLHGKKAAVPALLGDVFKGLFPLLLGQALGLQELVIALSGLAAFLGHLYPVFFAFRGGKGIATFIGVLLGINWLLGVAFMITWLVIALLSRYSSLAGLVSSAMTPVYVLIIIPQPVYLVCISIMVLFIFWKHRNNIRNLVAGTESKIGTDNHRQ